jgi:hypothetical protein
MYKCNKSNYPIQIPSVVTNPGTWQYVGCEWTHCINSGWRKRKWNICELIISRRKLKNSEEKPSPVPSSTAKSLRYVFISRISIKLITSYITSCRNKLNLHFTSWKNVAIGNSIHSLSIYLSIYLSICLSVCLSVCLSMALQAFVGPWPLFSFYTVGRTSCTGDQPVERPLPAHRATQTSMAKVRFEITIPVSERAKDSSCLRPRGHCDRQFYTLVLLKTLR